MYIDPTARREVARYFAFVVCVLAVFFASPSSAQIVALGASNVQGYGVSASDSFPAQLEAMLRAKRKPYSVANAGISGDTSAGMMARLNSAVPQGTKIVIIAISGFNDVRRGGTLEQARANAHQITSQLSARGVRVIDAMPYIRSAIQKGLVQNDRIHLTPEGHRLVASQLAARI
jgi:acyl-CoA thioesterase I